MKFILTPQSQEQITELLRQHHEKSLKDLCLEISGSSPFAAITLANNIPEWVRSIYLHDMPNDVRLLFEKNLTKSKRDLIQDKKPISVELPRGTEKEIFAKKQRRNLEEALDPGLRGLFTLRDPLVVFLSVISDISLLQSIGGIGRKQRFFVYLRILQLNSRESFSKQKRVLAIFIKKADVFLKDTGIKTALMSYRNREDLPPLNRILVAACLAIIAVFENAPSEFHSFMKELFALSVVHAQLFSILCGYIDLYQAKKIECKFTDEVRYSIDIGKFSYLDPQEDLQIIRPQKLETKQKLNREWTKLNMVLTSSNVDSDSIKEAVKNCNEMWADTLGCLELERKLFGIILQYFVWMQKMHPTNDYFPFDFSNSEFPPSMANEFAEFCFSVNCFGQKLKPDNLFVTRMEANWDFVSVVKLFSPEKRARVAGAVFNSLEELLNDPLFILVKYNRSSFAPVDLKEFGKEISNYLYLLGICSFQKLVEFFQNQIKVLLQMDPEEAMKATRFHFIIQFLPGKIGSLLINDICLLYQHLPESRERWPIAKTIMLYLEKRHHPNSLNWDQISKGLAWYGVLTIGGLVLDKKPFPNSEKNFIVALHDRCRNHSFHLAVVGGQTAFSSARILDDVELYLMQTRCYFNNEEDFTASVKKEIKEEVNCHYSRFSKLSKGNEGEKLTVLLNIAVLAPYMEIELVEKFFDEVNQQLEQIEPLRRELEFHILQTLTNLILYISSEKRQSYLMALPQKARDKILSCRSRLTFHALNLICEKEELRQIPGILKHLIELFYPLNAYQSGEDHFTMRKLGLAKKIMILLYKERKDLDFASILRPSLEFVAGKIQRQILATMVVELFNMGDEDNSLFESFKNVYLEYEEQIGENTEEKIVERLQDVLGVPEQANEIQLSIEPISEMRIG